MMQNETMMQDEALEMNAAPAVPADAAESADAAVVYTAEEVKRMLQSEADRRVSMAQRRWEKESGEKYAVLAEKVRADLKADYEKEYAKLREEADAAKESAQHRANTLECVMALHEKGLPDSFAEFLSGDDSEKMRSRVDALSGLVTALVNDRVRGRIAAFEPKVPDKSPKAGISNVKDMTLEERQCIFDSDRVLWNELRGSV